LPMPKENAADGVNSSSGKETFIKSPSVPLFQRGSMSCSLFLKKESILFPPFEKGGIRGDF
jgi:hypothetical protein